MRLTRSRPFSLLLLFCLLFGQWATGAHALSHLPPLRTAVETLDAPDGDGRAASHVCLECLAGHALDLALPAHALASGPPAVAEAVAVPAPHRDYAGAWLLARSRAPPASL